MRLFRGSVLAAVLCVVPLAVGGDRAMAIFACGTFDGKFQCKETPGAAPIGKNATPGAIDSASPEEPPQAPPDGAWQSTTSTPPAAEGAGNASQGGRRGGWGWGKKEETGNPGEHACPPGYRVLAVPSKYGYCEPPEGTAEAVS